MRGDSLVDNDANAILSRLLVCEITCECTIVALVLATAAQPPGQSELDCTSTKVTITNAPEGTISALTEEHLTFLINDEARTIAFSDGSQLRLSRFE
jgi:hypothetical protein